MNVTINRLKGALKRREAPIYTGLLNLNLVGVRSGKTDDNTFNDLLCVLYDDESEKTVLKTFPITTDPGLYYRKNPINVSGTAVLVPGHYPRCWMIGAHRGRYEALVQRGPMSVYRDANRDGAIDARPENIETGYFGINLHHAAPNGYTLRVDRWSAGCQVFAQKRDFDEVMDLVRQSAERYGPFFSYTLLNEDELK